MQFPDLSLFGLQMEKDGKRLRINCKKHFIQFHVCII